MKITICSSSDSSIETSIALYFHTNCLLELVAAMLSLPVGIGRNAVTAIYASEGKSGAKSALKSGLGWAFGVTMMSIIYSNHDDGARRALEMGAIALGAGALAGAASPFEEWRKLRQ